MSVNMPNQSNAGDLKLFELPDACIVSALALTTPKDACRVALVASWCRPFASSDYVWDSFLPADYRDILSRSPEGLKLLETPMSKKELYLHLCDHPLLIDDGTKSFTLDKASGKKQFMLSAKALAIVWGNTPAYWKFVPRDESRFSSVAELIMVCWLEIQGVINTKMLSPNTKYAAYLVYELKSGFYGFEHPPAEASVGLSGDLFETQFVHLDPDGAVSGVVMPRRHVVSRWWGRRHYFLEDEEAAAAEAEAAAAEPSSAPQVQARSSKRRSDGWMEAKLGELYVKGDEDADIEMRLVEVKGGNWKSGLCVEGIEMRAVVE